MNKLRRRDNDTVEHEYRLRRGCNNTIEQVYKESNVMIDF